MNISLTHCSYIAGGHQIIKDLSLHIPQGTITALMAPSGRGKTTILKLIAGIIQSTHGNITVGEKNPASWHGIGHVSYVPQQMTLLPWCRVRDSILFPCQIMGIPHNPVVMENLIEILHIQSLMDRYPHQLSGGQQQRVMIARALIQSPQLLIRDEPFRGLDYDLTHSLCEQLRLLARSQQTTMVFSTHHDHEARLLADDVLVLNS